MLDDLKSPNRLFLVICPPPSQVLEMGVQEPDGNRFDNCPLAQRSESLEINILSFIIKTPKSEEARKRPHPVQRYSSISTRQNPFLAD
jgi:hypothetical protein